MPNNTMCHQNDPYDDVAVAVVLAARGTQELKGEELLEKVEGVVENAFDKNKPAAPAKAPPAGTAWWSAVRSTKEPKRLSSS